MDGLTASLPCLLEGTEGEMTSRTVFRLGVGLGFVLWTVLGLALAY